MKISEVEISNWDQELKTISIIPVNIDSSYRAKADECGQDGSIKQEAKKTLYHHRQRPACS